MTKYFNMDELKDECFVLVKAFLDKSDKPHRNGNVRVRFFVNDANNPNNILTETLWISSRSFKIIKNDE
jgi:hypothetical protein